MKFKKGLSLLLALTLTLSLCACGKQKADNNQPDDTTTTTSTTSTEATTTTTTTTTKTTTEVTKPNVTVRPAVDGVENILLFGLDERGKTGKSKDETGKSKSFHSDSMLLLTIDRRDANNPRIKMTALARDTLVYIEGYSSTGHKAKLTVAFDYGYRQAKQKGKNEEDSKHAGAKMAVKTINQNFGLDISDYIFVNFVEFAEIVDYLGGVTVDVKEKERVEMNKHISAANAECGMSVKKLSSAGQQKLTGGQALAYCRVRKIDSDLVRTQRQRTVLKALFDQVKSSSADKVAGMIGKLTDICHTNISTGKLVELATWAFGNKPSFKNYTLPNNDCNYWGGSHKTYGWVFIYDMDYAAALLYDFMYDTSEAKEMSKPTKYRG